MAGNCRRAARVRNERYGHHCVLTYHINHTRPVAVVVVCRGSVYFLHRDEEFFFQKVLLKLDICPDLYSTRPSRNGCDFDAFL